MMQADVNVYTLSCAQLRLIILTGEYEDVIRHMFPDTCHFQIILSKLDRV